VPPGGCASNGKDNTKYAPYRNLARFGDDMGNEIKTPVLFHE